MSLQEHIASLPIPSPANSALVGVDPAQIEVAWNVLTFYGLLLLAGIATDIVLLSRMTRTPRSWLLGLHHLQWRPWTGGDILRMILIIVAAHLIVFGAWKTLYLLGVLAAREQESYWFIIHSFALHWVALFFILYVLYRRRLSWRRAFGMHRSAALRHTGMAILGYLAVLPPLLFYLVLYYIWMQFTGHEYRQQDVVDFYARITSVPLRVYYVVLAIAIAPVVEELIFRGLFLPVFAKRVGMAPAVALSSILFASIHLHGASWIPLFILSIALSVAYIYTRSLTVPIVMHALFNLVSLGVLTYVTGT